MTLPDALWLTGETVRGHSDPEGGNSQGLGDARQFYKTPPQLPRMGRLPIRQSVKPHEAQGLQLYRHRQ